MEVLTEGKPRLETSETFSNIFRVEKF